VTVTYRTPALGEPHEKGTQAGQISDGVNHDATLSAET
jgi:hypothetical protein